VSSSSGSLKYSVVTHVSGTRPTRDRAGCRGWASRKPPRPSRRIAFGRGHGTWTIAGESAPSARTIPTEDGDRRHPGARGQPMMLAQALRIPRGGAADPHQGDGLRAALAHVLMYPAGRRWSTGRSWIRPSPSLAGRSRAGCIGKDLAQLASAARPLLPLDEARGHHVRVDP
jgi:hypothetical protein